MYNVRIEPTAYPVFLNFAPLPQRMSNEEFQRFCQQHEGWRIEMSKEGDIEIMPPTGGETGRFNSRITRKLDEWAEEHGGAAFDSSTMFTLPDGAIRSPDASWVRAEIWEMLTPDERSGFPPICPDFVVELRSPSDRLAPLKAKMEEYIENGAQLGWLIDPLECKVYVYRPFAPVECLETPERLSGDPLLPGFLFPVSQLWQK